MDTTVDIQPEKKSAERRTAIEMKNSIDKDVKKNRRGRPKGARTTSLTDVRRQATEERKKIKSELGEIIEGLQSELLLLKRQYEQETGRLNNEIELMKRRESNYQQALGARLHEVAEHLQSTLLSWGTAELEEAKVDKRGRGRPRKTLK